VPERLASILRTSAPTTTPTCSSRIFAEVEKATKGRHDLPRPHRRARQRTTPTRLSRHRRITSAAHIRDHRTGGDATPRNEGRGYVLGHPPAAVRTAARRSGLEAGSSPVSMPVVVETSRQSRSQRSAEPDASAGILREEKTASAKTLDVLKALMPSRVTGRGRRANGSRRKGLRRHLRRGCLQAMHAPTAFHRPHAPDGRRARH